MSRPPTGSSIPICFDFGEEPSCLPHSKGIAFSRSKHVATTVCEIFGFLQRSQSALLPRNQTCDARLLHRIVMEFEVKPCHQESKSCRLILGIKNNRLEKYPSYLTRTIHSRLRGDAPGLTSANTVRKMVCPSPVRRQCALVHTSCCRNFLSRRPFFF